MTMWSFVLMMGVHPKCKQLLLWFNFIIHRKEIHLSKRIIIFLHDSQVLDPWCCCPPGGEHWLLCHRVPLHLCSFHHNRASDCYPKTQGREGPEHQLHQDKLFLHHRPGPPARHHLGFCLLQSWTSAHTLLLHLHHPQLLSRYPPKFEPRSHCLRITQRL